MDSTNINTIYRNFANICGSLVVISGLVYLILQWIFTKGIVDTLFISLSIGASILILYYSRNIINFIKSNRSSFFFLKISEKESENSKIQLDTSKMEYDKLLDLFSNFKLLIPVGVAWGTVAAFIPQYFNTWPDYVYVRFAFSLFIFFVCFITGFYFIILIYFFNISKSLWDLINVELWKRKNEASEFLLRLSRKTSIIAAVYISVCLLAWITSPLIPVSTELIIYVAFSFLLLIGSIIIPIRPFTDKIKKLKHDHLNDIDDQIQKEYANISEELRNSSKEVSFNQMNMLIEMRKKIESINIYPYRIQTLTASFSIIVISLLPVLLQFLFEKFFN